MSRAGLQQRNNTSGVPGVRARRACPACAPGVRARWRKPRQGRPQLGLDVRFLDGTAWRFTTLPATLDGMTRAIALREQTTGAVLPIKASTALRRARQAAGSPERCA